MGAGREKKPFRFRKRLWHEPPEGQDLIEDYSCFEYYDAVQKEFRQEGGKDLEWRSTWLDLNTEKQLLYHHIEWAQIESGTRHWMKQKTPRKRSARFMRLFSGIWMSIFVSWRGITGNCT